MWVSSGGGGPIILPATCVEREGKYVFLAHMCGGPGVAATAGTRLSQEGNRCWGSSWEKVMRAQPRPPCGQ